MIDLRTKYLGLQLKNPLVVSAGPIGRELSLMRKAEDSGASAIVMHSLFEEQIEIESQELDRFLWESADSSAEATSYYPEPSAFRFSSDEYLEHLAKAKAALGVPVIASLNGITTGGWTRYAKMMEQAGADALELNIYFVVTDPAQPSQDVEAMYIDLVCDVVNSVKIPVAVKLAPYFTSVANIANRIVDAGAKGLVLFNRFYQPEFDLERQEVIPNLTLSRSNELPLRLFWTAVLHGEVKADLAVTGGVHTVDDVVKSIMAGANVTMMMSALLEQGVDYLATLHRQLTNWLENYEYDSIEQMRGSMSRGRVAHPAAFDRANYMKVLSSYSLGLPVR